ncbi:MAG: hypothetical protein KJO00_05350 [Bacteroidia bacterium]|nr:hypothetical protein [Bacteroidia bacterium]NNF82581.1 hypothetical protein [Flavobacteriaceae bacterium]MBT8270114.1 hypothetical protein [Bacteroidia bacterium]MBT8287420.1 hypothetical protein [Bacteroidia bacterium]NNK70346.1 hypothetical protein [Flavobacteriaceae bacterium]
MKRKLTIVMGMLLALTLVTTSCKDKTEEKSNTESSLGAEKADLAMNAEYQCPMDCEDGKTYEEQGTCPECKMDLKKVEEEHNEHEDAHDDHSGHDHD